MSDEGKNHVTTRQIKEGKQPVQSDMGSPAPLTSTPTPRVGWAEQASLGHRLGEFYKHLLDEPVPDRFIQLLAELEKQRD
jgi:hypothetical protein